MLFKKALYKLYLKFFIFSLLISLSLYSNSNSAVLTEEELKYIESQSDLEKEDEKDKKTYIEYEDIEKKEKKNPFSFFGTFKKKKKKASEKIKKSNVLEKVSEPQKLKVGILLPLTGKYSYFGQSLLDTMQMVVFENKNIESELIIKDTKANPSLAKKATKELVDQNVDVILGPFFSESLNKSLKIAKYKNQEDQVIRKHLLDSNFLSVYRKCCSAYLNLFEKNQ